MLFLCSAKAGHKNNSSNPRVLLLRRKLIGHVGAVYQAERRPPDGNNWCMRCGTCLNNPTSQVSIRTDGYRKCGSTFQGYTTNHKICRIISKIELEWHTRRSVFRWKYTEVNLIIYWCREWVDNDKTSHCSMQIRFRCKHTSNDRCLALYLGAVYRVWRYVEGPYI